MIYRFNKIEIDSDNYSIKDAGVLVTVEPQVFDLIVYLIEHNEKMVSRNEIFDTLWAGKVVGDAALSTRIKMARSALGDNGQSQSVIKTIHGRGYQFVAEIQESSIQPALLPERQDEVDIVPPTARDTYKLKPYFIVGIVLVALLVVGVLIVKFYTPQYTSGSSREKSIAVLPFENSSNQTDDLYFTDGIHGDLLTQISGIKDLKSISRTSVMTYRGSEKNLQQIAEELGVATILEGGVQRSGNQVRINMQLIDAKTDVPIWSVTYTRELTAENIFQIQTEIASAVAEKLKVELSLAERHKLDVLPTQNLAALELYFKAKAETQKATSKGYQKAVDYLKQAISMDENFVNAYMELANVYLVQTFYGGLPRDIQLNLAYDVIKKAKALEGESSTIVAIEAQYVEYNNQFELAEEAYQRAIALNPNNGVAYANYGHMLNWIFFNYAKSIQMYEMAISLDPANINLKQQLAEVLNNGGRAQEAISVLEGIIAQNPNIPTVWLGLCRTYAEALFQYDKAIPACLKAQILDPDNSFFPNFTALAYGNIGEPTLMAKFAKLAYSLNSEVKSHLGEQLFAENKPQEAFKAFYAVKKGTIYFRHSNSYVANIGLKYDLQGALQYFSDNYPELMDEDLKVDAQNLYQAYYFALLLEASGDHQSFERIIDKGMAYIAQLFSDIPLRALPIVTSYHIAAGQTDKAFNYFSEFVARGGATGDVAYVGAMANLLLEFPRYPAWDGKPEVEALRVKMKERLRQQRSNLQAMEGKGELVAIPEMTD